MYQNVESASSWTMEALLDAGFHTYRWANDAQTILYDAAAHREQETLAILSIASLTWMDVDVENSNGITILIICNTNISGRAIQSGGSQ